VSISAAHVVRPITFFQLPEFIFFFLFYTVGNLAIIWKTLISLAAGVHKLKHDGYRLQTVRLYIMNAAE
jgi:hypothetical protein